MSLSFPMKLTILLRKNTAEQQMLQIRRSPAGAVTGTKELIWLRLIRSPAN